MSIIMRGSDVSDGLKAEILAEADELGITPELAVVRVGSRPDDLAYERGIKKRFDGLGLGVTVHEFPDDITQSEFDEAFSRINSDEKVHGILLFRPLAGLSDEAARSLINPLKDIDGMSRINQAKIFAGEPDAFAPCTPLGVMAMFRYYDIELEGKNTVIIGRSMVAGRPLAMLMLGANSTVTICHTKTLGLQEICRRSDIIITAAGKAKMLTKDYVTENSVVVDVGINVDGEGRLCGDCDFEGISPIVRAVSPVPGGAGAVTTSMLAKNLIRSVKLQKK